MRIELDRQLVTEALLKDFEAFGIKGHPNFFQAKSNKTTKKTTSSQKQMRHSSL